MKRWGDCFFCAETRGLKRVRMVAKEVGGNHVGRIGRKYELGHPFHLMNAPHKAALREEIRGRIAQMDAAARTQASRRIEECVLARSEWQQAGTVALFLSLTDEPQTRGILRAAWAADKRVALPKIDIREGLTWWQMPPFILPESSSLWEPSPEKSVRIPVGEIHGFLIPGRAFTATGARLGRGGGHYDRTLVRRSREAWVTGLFFAVQEMESLPQEHHDIPLPSIVTEHGWRKTA